MAAHGFQDPPNPFNTVMRDLMHGLKIDTWDGAKELMFFVFSDDDNDATSGGTYPAATIRVPRGVVFHCETDGKGPPPHTIHWHGIEPTPINDGVGHCSMEIGHYTYQFQPNHIGTYFYHCHRNTMQHFEFGLFGMLLIDPPDAYFASIWKPTEIPLGCGRDGKRRTAANLTDYPQFPDFIGGDIRDPDPEADNPDLPAYLKFATDPHAMTVAYDVEALWVFDDRDSVWSDMAPNARATFPKQGNTPGVDDRFNENPGQDGFFAFNDFHADYWFVTGVPVPAHKGGTASIPPGLTVPAALNSGVEGQQVSIQAGFNQTVLVRMLDAAYNSLEIIMPVDVVIIAWDGRALGAGPHGFNHAYEIPAGEPFRICTARRCDMLFRTPAVPFNGFATVKFINSRGEKVEDFAEEILCTAKVPIEVGNFAPAPGPIKGRKADVAPILHMLLD
jgi:hypothetical protein